MLQNLEKRGNRVGGFSHEQCMPVTSLPVCSPPDVAVIILPPSLTAFARIDTQLLAVAAQAATVTRLSAASSS
jgi:hypothetical protein